MKCKFCNSRTAIHDLWCINCGKPTEVIRKDLSAITSLKNTWLKFTKTKSQNYPTGIWAVLLGVIPMIIVFILLHIFVSDSPQWKSVLITNAIWMFFIPLLLVPFRAICQKDSYIIRVSEFFNSFKSYFRYLLISLSTAVFYIAIFFICQGDAVLNLVWLILVNYWLAIIMPVPILMERYQINALKAIFISYNQFGDVRWNIYLLLIVLFVINAVALFFLLIGLLITIPFTWFTIRDYVDKLIEYELIVVNK